MGGLKEETGEGESSKRLMVITNPLDEPKRAQCSICLKKFKNQSALNGHMRLHGGYNALNEASLSPNNPASNEDSSLGSTCLNDPSPNTLTKSSGPFAAYSWASTGPSTGLPRGDNFPTNASAPMGNTSLDSLLLNFPSCSPLRSSGISSNVSPNPGLDSSLLQTSPFNRDLMDFDLSPCVSQSNNAPTDKPPPPHSTNNLPTNTNHHGNTINESAQYSPITPAGFDGPAKVLDFTPAVVAAMTNQDPTLTDLNADVHHFQQVSMRDMLVSQQQQQQHSNHLNNNTGGHKQFNHWLSTGDRFLASTVEREDMEDRMRQQQGLAPVERPPRISLGGPINQYQVLPTSASFYPSNHNTRSNVPVSSHQSLLLPPSSYLLGASHSAPAPYSSNVDLLATTAHSIFDDLLKTGAIVGGTTGANSAPILSLHRQHADFLFDPQQSEYLFHQSQQHFHQSHQQSSHHQQHAMHQANKSGEMVHADWLCMSTNENTGHGEMDDDRLSRTMQDGGLFRNPHTPPPAKKAKKKPAPLFIPPQASVYLSRLRSPRVWDPTQRNIPQGVSPPPYTPPPMLSPIRKGSGLFYSIHRSGLTPNHNQGNTTPITPRLTQSATATGLASVMHGANFSATVTGSQSPLDAACIKRENRSSEERSPALSSAGSSSAFSHHALPSPNIKSHRSSSWSSEEAPKPVPEELMVESKRESWPVHSPDVTTAPMVWSERRRCSGSVSGGSFVFDYGDTADLLSAGMAGSSDVSGGDQSLMRSGEDVEDGLPTCVMPMINEGCQYQAEIPDYIGKPRCRRVMKEAVRETLMWDPGNLENDPAKMQSLDLLMKIASSPAIKDCGLNMEYTFHLLCKFKGNFDETLQALLREAFVVYDYVYAETTPWTTEEIVQFQRALALYDRDFSKVSQELANHGIEKSVKACVEFYYMWKEMNTGAEVNKYRSTAIRRKRDHQQQISPSFVVSSTTLTSTHTPSTGISQIASCPDLQASLQEESSQQDAVLPDASGGGSYNLRRKPMDLSCPNCSVMFSTSRQQETHVCPTGSDTSRSHTPDSFMDAGGTSDEVFPCRLCDKIFHKVKSRNAHMKSHSEKIRHDTPVS